MVAQRCCQGRRPEARRACPFGGGPRRSSEPRVARNEAVSDYDSEFGLHYGNAVFLNVSQTTNAPSKD